MHGRPGLLAAAVATTLLVTASPAMAAADLSISATHSRGTLLKVEGTNTTVNPATLTLRVTQRRAPIRRRASSPSRTRCPTGLTALINDAPSGAGAVAASGAGWTCVAHDVHALGCAGAGRVLPGHQGDGQDGQHRAGVGDVNAPTVSGGGDADGASASDMIPIVTDACTNGWAASEKIAVRAAGAGDRLGRAERRADRRLHGAGQDLGGGAVRLARRRSSRT